MSRTYLDSLVTEKALAVLNQSSMFHDYVYSSVAAGLVPEDVPIPDGMASQDVKVLQDFAAQVAVPVKNVCAKVPPELSDEIDNIVALLHISKRQFLEAAFIDAVNRAKDIIQQEGVYEYLDRAANASETVNK